jgi:acylphosphatase
MQVRVCRFVIQGTVQGVGYRNFAQRVARELRIAGWVRNLPDGSVEALACGPAAKLDRFAGELRIGPPRAEVRHVNAEEVAPGDKIVGFQIR